MEPVQLLIPILLLCMAPRGSCCRLSRKGRSVQSHAYEIAVAEKLTEPLSLLSMNTTKNDQENEVRYLLRYEGRDHLLHLVKARDLLAETYSESHYLADGSRVTERRHHLNHCCYTGFVEGVEDSSVSLCTCQGLSGYISIGDQGYAIDPVQDGSHKHKVSRSEHVRSKRGLPLSPAKLTFLQNEGDLKKTKDRLITLAHHVNQIYHRQLNIQIFLVGIEIWTTENKVNFSQDSSEALLKFMKWRSEELVPRKHHDNAQLISGVPFQKSLGQAYLNEMCSKERSGGVVKDTSASTREVAKYIAHEIGHNLGMYHDEPTCHCPVTSGKCLLAASAVWMLNPIFSDCSRVFLDSFLNQQNIICLMDQPDNSMNITVALINDDTSVNYKIGTIVSASLLFLIIAILAVVVLLKKGKKSNVESTYHSSEILLQHSTV
ncbi:snake venom metalloproteinase BjussuMP-2-like isoform X2 [Heptranchias perlo]|uniref:snake venom metalloproteinase BjussuMP-2-like isoform X2 n=1 Tax=Heptranchias perlo TaxID=212740 RepID=UPI00355AC65C